MIATPWHILAIYQHTDFAFWYFVNEHYYRFLDKRWPDDYASQKEIWVSSLNLIGMVMPWSILCIINVKKVYKDVYKNTFVKFCLLWLTLFLIFFTVSSSTASYYMLIAIPATVVLMVVVLQNTMSRRQLIVAYVITAVLLIVAIYKADLLSSSIYYIAFISIIGLGVVFTKKYTFEKVSISTLFIILTVFAFIPKRLYDDRSSVTIYDTVINMAKNDFAEIVLWQEYEDSLTAFAFLYGKPLLNDGFCVKKKMNLINILSNKNCK